MRADMTLRRLVAWLILVGLVAGAAVAQEPASPTGPADGEQPVSKAKKPERPVNVLKGTVLDEKTREPLAGVIVAAADAEMGHISWFEDRRVFVSAPDEKVLLFFTRRNGKRGGKATTDDKGNFAIRNLKHGTYNIAAIHPDKGLTLVADISFSKDSKPLEVVLQPFEAAPEHVFEGRVLDADGKPVSEARVNVAATENGFIHWSGGDNVFAYVGNQTDEDFPWFSDQGNFGDTGGVRTDAKGEFSIPKLKHGSYTLLAAHKSKGVTVMDGVEFDEDSKPLDVVIEAPAFVEGTLKGLKMKKTFFGGHMLRLDPEGLPAQVYLNIDIDYESDGRFRAGPLPRAKKWTLTASKQVSKQGYVATLLRVPLQIEPGKTVIMNVDLTENSQFAGEVRGPKDEPLSGVSVLATAGDASGWAFGAVTDKDGKYTLKGLPEGKYTLKAMRHVKRTAPG